MTRIVFFLSGLCCIMLLSTEGFAYQGLWQHELTGESILETSLYPAKQIDFPPYVDGIADDECWASAPWAYIDQSWIVYGQQLEPSDFTGRYKAVWIDPIVYLLVEITDDVLIDDNPVATQNYPNYDCIEIFVDEDHSGGEHQNDCNAFAYHVSTKGDPVDIVGDGEVYMVAVMDHHFDEFAFNADDAPLYIWELGMIIIKEDCHTESQLEIGKRLGFSLAYCDNDTREDPLRRDHFIGSVWVPEDKNNDHWIDAGLFGDMLLKGPNQAPYVDKAISSQALDLTAQAAVILADLDTIFADDDNAELSYSVTTDNTALLPTIVDGHWLSISANQTTSGLVSVRASDGELTTGHNFNIDVTTGVKELSPEAFDFDYYPNPAEDRLTVSCYNKYKGPVQISLFDLSGHLILTHEKTKQTNSFQAQLDVSILVSGCYILQIQIETTNKQTLLFVH